MYDPAGARLTADYWLCGADWSYANFSQTSRAGWYLIRYSIDGEGIAFDQFQVAAPVTSAAPTSRSEWVYVVSLDTLNNHAVIWRANGEYWWVEYGVGCLRLWRFENKAVLIVSPGRFAGIGSEIVLPDDAGRRRIWDSRFLR